MMDDPGAVCPLCGVESPFVVERQGRRYFSCPSCRLVFLHPSQHPSPEAEKRRYSLHDNDPADPGYRRMLLTLAEPCMTCIENGAACLDYGCGRVPAMGAIFAERGWEMDGYDPFFFPDFPSRQYDLITCCEAAEHFFSPKREFDRIVSLLRPGGVLGVRTALWDEETDFGSWHYLTDPTHVSLYHRETFEWIARHCRLTIEEQTGGKMILARKRN